MLMSPEEFLVYDMDDEEQGELVRGELRVTPAPGAPHGMIATNLAVFLSAHVRDLKVGWVFTGSVGYQLIDLPRTVRRPDVSFVRADRLPSEGVGPGFLKLAPDLVVEVLSPSETASALEEKLDDYRACGTSLIWVVDPQRRKVMIIASDAPPRWVREGDRLDGGAVLPGFSCGVADLLVGVAR
ncbi:MAG: Uma2 family endonuclease [Gemmatimonadota bacterium]|nr:Uma2 family endonuclease [Gemmatimonadota bacterium]